MSIQRILISCLCLFVLCFTGCSPQDSETASSNGEHSIVSHAALQPSKVDDKTLNTVKELSIRTEKTSYSPGTVEIWLILSNRTNKELRFGDEFTLQVKQNGQWMEIPMLPEAYFYAISNGLPANDDLTWLALLSKFDFDAGPGQYRIIKPISYGGKDSLFSAEFTIQ